MPRRRPQHTSFNVSSPNLSAVDNPLPPLQTCSWIGAKVPAAGEARAFHSRGPSAQHCRDLSASCSGFAGKYRRYLSGAPLPPWAFLRAMRSASIRTGGDRTLLGIYKCPLLSLAGVGALCLQSTREELPRAAQRRPCSRHSRSRVFTIVSTSVRFEGVSHV